MYKFMVALRTFLIQTVSKDLPLQERETQIRTQDGYGMGVHHFAGAMDGMQTKLIEMQGHTCITDEVKIRNFHNNMPDFIK